MKDWRASIRSWESNTTNKAQNKEGKLESQINAWQGAKNIIKQQLNK